MEGTKGEAGSQQGTSDLRETQPSIGVQGAQGEQERMLNQYLKYRAQIKVLQRKLQTEQENTQALELKLKEVTHACEHATEQLKVEERKSVHLQAMIDELTDAKKNLEEKLKTTEQQKLKLEAMYKEKEEQNRDLERKLERMQEEIKAHTNKIQNLEADVEASRELLVEHLASTDEEARKLRLDAAQENFRAKRLEKLNDDLNEDLDTREASDGRLLLRQVAVDVQEILLRRLLDKWTPEDEHDFPPHTLRGFDEYVQNCKRENNEDAVAKEWDVILRELGIASGRRLTNAMGLLKKSALKDAHPSLTRDKVQKIMDTLTKAPNSEHNRAALLLARFLLARL